MRDRREIENVKALLQGRIHDLVAELVPDGKLLHGYWMGTNPARTDARPGSFWIIVSRPGKTPGAWRDEAVNNLKGDVIGLIAMIRCGGQNGPAIQWAKKWLNFETLPSAQVEKARLDSQARRKKAEEFAARQLEDDQKRAFAIYLDSKYEDRERKRPRDLMRTLAGAYLRHRRCDLSLLPRIPGAIGFLPHVKHIASIKVLENGEPNYPYKVERRTERRPDGRETVVETVVSYWPAMVIGMGDDDGHIKCVHRTFLARDGIGAEHPQTNGKAPIEPARKMWPSSAGLVGRLWRGETDMTPAEAAKHGLLDTLVIGEGAETCLPAALARPEFRVWMAGSLPNLRNIKLPACCERVIVLADNDWGKPEAQASLNAGLDALARQGRRRIDVARSPIGKDFNDLIRGAA